MLKNKVLAYKTKTLIKRNKIDRSSTRYDLVKSIGIVFSSEDLKKHKTVKKFVHQLEKDGKKVHVLTFLPEGIQNFEFLFDFFTPKDISFWGNFTEEVVDFASKPFDYLFYLDDNNNPLISNIMAMSKAKCRVGKYNEPNSAFCELMIKSSNGSIESLADEMYKYTKILS